MAGTESEEQSEESAQISRKARLKKLPPSTKLVYKVLEDKEARTLKEISNESLLPHQTTRFAVQRLRDNNLIEERVCLSDARKRILTAKPLDD